MIFGMFGGEKRSHKPKKQNREIKNEKKDKSVLNRRNFLIGGALAAGAVATSKFLKEGEDSPIKTEPQKTGPLELDIRGGNEKKEEGLLRFLNVEYTPKVYNMGKLAGVKFGGLLALYSGITGEVPENAKICFRTNLAKLWRLKIEKYKKEKGEYSMEIIQTAKNALTEYEVAISRKTNLRDWLLQIDEAKDEISEDIDWSKITKESDFGNENPKSFGLLRHIEKNILKSFSLLAYSVTELMPTSGGDSKIGIELYNFLLKNAGEEYLDFIPALGDNLVSMGCYQFTTIAVNEVNNMQRKYLRSQNHVPDKIEKLRGEQNHKAAYLFALHNVMQAIRRIKEEDAEVLLKTKKITIQDIEYFIAAAHNLPSKAFQAFDAYVKYIIDDEKKKEQSKKDKNKNKKTKNITPIKLDYLYFIKKISPEIGGVYAQKTRDNRYALKNHYTQYINSTPL